VTAFTLPRHISVSRGPGNLFLKERAIPLRKWAIYTAYFLSINMLNNLAFGYKIGVPLHIILRSAGPVTTMLAGRVWKGRRYPPQKIVAVLLLFCGVVLAAVSDAWAKQDPTASMATAQMDNVDGKAKTGSAVWSQAPGFALLASALILSAAMGIFTDDMYATHGRSGAITAETLFYSHAMSLPYFLSQIRPLFHEFTTLLHVPSSAKSSTSLVITSPITRQFFLLALNAATQLLCIVGVNRLSAQSSALTVSIVLNVRKLASLLLSIWLFGNELPWGVLVGAAIVFVGGGMYALPVREKGKEKVKDR
jgi:solute carrier family 35 (UDP-xylose/UDP-N-acetylglucosamine transporter), member B4